MILVILGTRPEAIKLAPVIWAMGEQCKVLSTGQHDELLWPMLDTFGIQLAYELDLMDKCPGLTGLAGEAIQQIGAIIRWARPSWVVVQGDTASALAGALAAYYSGVRVAHVEAGLRTYDLSQPYPEEGNRQMISRIASLHFAPTESARTNLLSEHIPLGGIDVVGNTAIDTLAWALRKLPELQQDTNLITLTIHRRENWAKIPQICQAMNTLGNRYGFDIVCPTHPNPTVRDALREHARFRLIEPLGYLDFVQQLRHSWLIITDSGGIQEEAPSLGVPVLVLRDKTERPEAVSSGAALLVGTDPERLVCQVQTLMHNRLLYRKMVNARNPFGDGHAAERIAGRLLGEV